MMNIKKDFPMLERSSHTYLNSAATTLKPQCVIDALTTFYMTSGLSPKRGIDSQTCIVEEAYEETRLQVARFIHAQPNEIIFTRGTTSSLNMIARMFETMGFTPGDELLVSEGEHHANFIPWQELTRRLGMQFRIVPLNEDGRIDPDVFARMLSKKTKLVAFFHVSNVLGTMNDVKTLCQLAHDSGAYCIVDGAQAILHTEVNVSDLNCDFYAFSAHKMLGPMGVGILYGKTELLEALPPVEFGGEMNVSVSRTETLYKEPPYKYEAGTMMIADVLGLGVALTYITKLGGIRPLQQHVQALLAYAEQRFSELHDVVCYSPPNNIGGMITYNHATIHAHDAATIYDESGVLLRTGHHCAMPLHTTFGVSATLRMSLGAYNTPQDIDRWIEAANRVEEGSFLNVFFK